MNIVSSATKNSQGNGATNCLDIWCISYQLLVIYVVIDVVIVVVTYKQLSVLIFTFQERIETFLRNP